jgi:hypothetical protein
MRQRESSPLHFEEQNASALGQAVKHATSGGIVNLIDRMNTIADPRCAYYYPLRSGANTWLGDKRHIIRLIIWPDDGVVDDETHRCVDQVEPGQVRLNIAWAFS